MTEPTVSWQVCINRSTFYGETKNEVLETAAESIKEQEEKGLSWQLKQVWTTERTKPRPITLIIGSSDENDHRPHEDFIDNFNNTYMSKFSLGVLTNIDSSGTRSVYLYNKNGVYNYDDADDFPEDIFNHLAIYLQGNNVPVHLYLREEDPCIGIMLKQDTEENHWSYRQDNPLKQITDNL